MSYQYLAHRLQCLYNNFGFHGSKDSHCDLPWHRQTAWCCNPAICNMKLIHSVSHLYHKIKTSLQMLQSNIYTIVTRKYKLI
jgi:hypothetical protein